MRWGWLLWALDTINLQPPTKYAWLIVPLSLLILAVGLGAFFLLWTILPAWALTLAGIGLGLACLIAEYVLVTRLMPARIRRAR